MNKKLTTILLVSLYIIAGAVNAHHSRSNFYLNKVISFEAEVTRYLFRNPHSFLYINIVNGKGQTENWNMELGSVANLKQMKMDGSSLKPGDKVVVEGSPDKNPKKKTMFLVRITKQDGIKYTFEDVFEYGRRVRRTSSNESGSVDFNGIWDMDIPTNQVLVGNTKPANYPVTEAGEALIASFDPIKNPTFSCLPAGVPKFVGSPYAMTIKRDVDAVYIASELSPHARTIYLNRKSHPDDAAPSLLGHSIGHFEGGTLVVDTTNFTPEIWGLGRGLDSSESKHVLERYALADEGRLLKVSIEVIDPVYLLEPIKIKHEWRYAPEYEVAEYVPCDIDAASKHLE